MILAIFLTITIAVSLLIMALIFSKPKLGTKLNWKVVVSAIYFLLLTLTVNFVLRL